MKKVLFLIFILALALRVWAVFAQDESERIPRSDAKQYDNIALNIVSGNGFSDATDGSGTPTMRRTPVYPLFLAGIYAIFGHNYMAVKIVQAFLGAFFCILIFFIANVLYKDEKIALVAALITAIYKPFIFGFHYYGGPAYLLSEYFYMFMLGLTVLASFFFIRKENGASKVLAGFLIGMTILTRPEFALYPIILGFYLFYKSRMSIVRFIKKYFILYFFIVLTISPWIARNYIVEDKFIPLSTLGGFVFWQGNNESADGSWGYPKEYRKVADETSSLSDYERDRIFYKKGMEYLKNNPERIPRFFTRKLLVHWAPFEKGFELFNPYYLLILVLGCVGFLLFRVQDKNMKNILLFLLFTTILSALVTYGDPRYRYPYEFCLIIFAAANAKKTFLIRK